MLRVVIVIFYHIYGLDFIGVFLLGYMGWFLRGYGGWGVEAVFEEVWRWVG